MGSATLRLHLDSGTSVEAPLRPAAGGSFTVDAAAKVTASFDGSSEPAVELLGDGRISVRVDGVPAHLLGSPVTVSLGGQEVLSFSALSYANAEIGSGHTGARDAMCALYGYHDATMAYRGQQAA